MADWEADDQTHFQVYIIRKILFFSRSNVSMSRTPALKSALESNGGPRFDFYWQNFVLWHGSFAWSPRKVQNQCTQLDLYLIITFYTQFNFNF